MPSSTHAATFFNQLRLRQTVPLLKCLYLSLPKHIHRFNATQGAARGIERPEPQHRFGNVLDGSVSLLDPMLPRLPPLCTTMRSPEAKGPVSRQTETDSEWCTSHSGLHLDYFGREIGSTEANLPSLQRLKPLFHIALL